MDKKNIVISESLHEERLDIALVKSELGLSRRKIRQIIDHGGCYVNKKRVRVASKKVFTGAKIELIYSEGSIVHQRKKLFFTAEHIVKVSDAYIAINKPWGVPSQATMDQSLVHVASLTRKYCDENNLPLNGAVLPAHRLDMETTGVMLLGTSKKTTQMLMDQFRDRKTKKVYHAICVGVPDSKEFEHRCQLSPIDRKTRSVRVINQGGKEAFTQFKVIGKSKSLNLSLIECRPETGRTHQLRVQLSYLGFPILGDKKYIHRKLNLALDLSSVDMSGHFLHARYLTFFDPKKNTLEQVAAPYFKEFLSVCEIAGLMK